MRANHSSRSAVVRWSRDSCNDLAMRPALFVEVHRARGGHDGAELAQAVVLACGLRHRGAVLPVGQAHGRQELVRHGEQGLRGDWRLSGRLGRGVLRVDRLAHRLQAAAQQLLRHGDLLGAQRGEHGVAVHGGRGCGRALAAGGPAVALAGPAATRPAWPAAAARAVAASRLVGPSRGSVARVAAVAVARPRRSSAVTSHRRRRRRGGACPNREPGSLKRRVHASGCRGTSIRPSVFSGERSGLAAVRERTSMPSRPSRRRPAAPNRPSRPRARGVVDGALGLPCARGAPGPGAVSRSAGQLDVDAA